MSGFLGFSPVHNTTFSSESSVEPIPIDVYFSYEVSNDLKPLDQHEKDEYNRFIKIIGEDSFNNIKLVPNKDGINVSQTELIPVDNLNLDSRTKNIIKKNYNGIALKIRQTDKYTIIWFSPNDEDNNNLERIRKDHYDGNF